LEKKKTLKTETQEDSIVVVALAVAIGGQYSSGRLIRRRRERE
jgi:hypothetical protein